MREEAYIYWINSQDIITAVSNNWTDFSGKNNGSDNLHPERLIGRSLWSVIKGDEIRHLYQQLLKEVRQHKTQVKVPFRCDAPDERRFLELLMERQAEGSIKFTSRLLKTEPREAVHLLTSVAEEEGSFLTICSMCKKIKMEDGSWLEIEKVIQELKLFDEPQLPKLSHGLCDCCLEIALEELRG